MITLDRDLEAMSRDDLLLAARQMRQAIRAHRDASGHDLCWYHPDLWALLPDKAAEPEVPEWPQFLRGCVAYRASLDKHLSHAGRIQEEFGK